MPTSSSTPDLPTEMSREQVFAWLARRGVTYAEVEFEGGGDEGQCTSVSLHLSDRDAPAQLDTSTWEPDPGRQGRMRKRADEDARLSDALQQPVYDRYGGFAGEFSVEGKVVWDVDARQVRLDATVGETEWHPEEGTLEAEGEAARAWKAPL